MGQLPEALDFQKKTGLALGEVLVSWGHQSLGSPDDFGSSIFFKDDGCDCDVGCFCILFLCHGLRWQEVLKDIPASITLSAVSLEQARGEKFNLLYSELPKDYRSSDLSSFTKWSDMFDRFNRDVTRESNNKILQQWKADLSDFRGQSVIEMADGVNTLLNKSQTYRDSQEWGQIRLLGNTGRVFWPVVGLWFCDCQICVASLWVF